MKKQLSALALGVTLAVLGSAAVLAVPQTVTTADPLGDVAKNAPGQGNEAVPAYFDILEATVTGDAAAPTPQFTMSMQLAASIPLTPPGPVGHNGLHVWLFGLDTRPDLVVKGFPFAPGHGATNDYFVFLTWDGTAFDAYIIDRTPLATGGEPVLTDIPVSFNADRTKVTFTFDATLIGSPTTFKWLSATIIRQGLGNDSFHIFDIITSAVTWPAE